MQTLYDFLMGPGLWISFTIFIGGLVVRLAFLKGLSRGRDPQLYNHVSWGWALKSIGHWLIPWGSRSLRAQPVFSLVFWLFHVGILFTPIFLGAHNVLWREAFGVAPWSLPDMAADYLTLMTIACAIFLFARRLVLPEVRILTGLWDYTLLVLTALPFVTGYLAYHQMGDYPTMMTLHVLFGEIILVVIPFSKLGHILLFFATRSFIGFEMGGRRGASAW